MTRVAAAALTITNAKERSGVPVVHCVTVVHRVAEEYGFTMVYSVQMCIALQ